MGGTEGVEDVELGIPARWDDLGGCAHRTGTELNLQPADGCKASCEARGGDFLRHKSAGGAGSRGPGSEAAPCTNVGKVTWWGGGGDNGGRKGRVKGGGGVVGTAGGGGVRVLRWKIVLHILQNEIKMP